MLLKNILVSLSSESFSVVTVWLPVSLKNSLRLFQIPFFLSIELFAFREPMEKLPFSLNYFSSSFNSGIL